MHRIRTWPVLPGRPVARAHCRAALTCALTPLAMSIAAASAPAIARAALPPQGLYEECAPSGQQQCAGELAQMGSAGFHLALNYTAWYGSAADIQAYASEAQADGVKLIWPLDFTGWRDPAADSTLPKEFSLLAPDCGCATNGDFLRYAINLVRGLPATWGYYIGDELPGSQSAAVASLAARVRAIDPTHPLLFVGQAFPDVATTLGPFDPTANVIGADVYPIGEGASAGVVKPVANALRQLADESNTRPALVLQSFDWSQYPTEIQAIDPRWPSEAEMETMRNEALAANPSMILWYSIYDILRSDDPAKHWHDLLGAAFAPLPSATSRRSPRGAGATIASLTQQRHGRRGVRLRHQRRRRLRRRRFRS